MLIYVQLKDLQWFLTHTFSWSGWPCSATGIWPFLHGTVLSSRLIDIWFSNEDLYVRLRQNQTAMWCLRQTTRRSTAQSKETDQAFLEAPILFVDIIVLWLFGLPRLLLTVRNKQLVQQMGANLSINMLQALTSSWLFKKTRRGSGGGLPSSRQQIAFCRTGEDPVRQNSVVMSYEMTGRIDPDGELEISSIRSLVSGEGIQCFHQGNWRGEAGGGGVSPH